MTTVDTGHRGVKVRFGEVIGEGLPEGLYLVNPLTTDIKNIDTRVQSWNSNTQACTREVGQHEAVDLISQRDTVVRTIEKNVTGLLARRNVIVTGFQLTNIDYTNEFEHAVEAKVIAQQNAIEEQNRTVQVREKANQQIETAKGNAESTILNAKAEAESIEIRARALERNAKLVEWEAVEKWNGTLPQYMMGNSVPFINIPAK